MRTLPGLRRPRLAAIAVALLLPTTVAAQRTAPPGALAVTAERVPAAGDSGRAARAAASPLRPGESVRYALRFTNTTDGAARNVRFANKVPAGLQFVGASATADRADVRVEYSIDGGRTFSTEPTIEVDEDGRRVRRPAPPAMITDLRWTVAGSVPAGDVVAVGYRAVWPGTRVATAGGSR